MACAGLLCPPAYGNVLSWSGGGANAYWNNSANWGNAGTPANGDTLIFPAGKPNLLNNNNIAGLTLNQILFVGSGGGYDLSGNAFTLTNSIMATNTAGVNIIENNITLATSTVLIVVSNSAFLTLGTLSGSVGVNKAGLGELMYESLVSNPYTGTTLVSGGTLTLNVDGVSAFGGPLVIGDGTGTGSPMVKDLQSIELKNTGPITINVYGTLNLNNYSETNINPSLTLNGGTIETGTGTLTLSPNTTITTTNDYGYIYGNLNTGSGTLTLQGNSLLLVYATVNGSANIVQNGSVNTYWSGTNTYTGNYTANGSGYVWPDNSLALGNANNAMTLNGQAWVSLDDNISITNQSLTINSTSSIIAIYVSAASTNTWQANFTLGSVCNIEVLTNCALNLNGPIGGAGGFTQIGAGTLTLSGTSGNTYAGQTVILGGTNVLAKTGVFDGAVPGNLQVGDATHSATVRYEGVNQIPNTAIVTLYDGCVFDLNGNYDGIGGLVLYGANVTMGSGFLAMYSPGTISALQPASITPNISGVLGLEVPVTVTANNSISISALIDASGSLTKTGSGNLYLSGANTYTGLTLVQQGYLWAENNLALGATNNGIVVSNGASLVLFGGIGITNEALALNGPGAAGDWGALDSETQSGTYGADLWVGPITLNADSTIDTWNTDDLLRIIGPITGAGGLTQIGHGTLSLEGSIGNTYAGTTTVSSGTILLLNKSVFNSTVPGNVVVSGTLLLGNNEQIAGTADVLVNSGGVFGFSAYYQDINTLHGTGSVTFGTGGYLNIGSSGGTSEFDGAFTGTGYAPGYTVGKFGVGTFTIGGNSTYTAGITHVRAGKVVINGSQPLIPVTVDSGSTLGGSGTVGSITNNGIISPGNSPGILNSSNVNFSSTGNFTVELTDPNPGVGGYDQLNVTGTVSLASATLTVIPAFTTPVSIGQQFTIINNDGVDAVSGTFNGLANGVQFSAGGYTFRINYAGGTGNDVVLTLLGIPGNTVTLNAVSQGWYNSAGTGNGGSASQNYAAGYSSTISDTNIYRNWVVFNAPVFTNSIIQAELLINCFQNSSSHGQETYLLRRVTTPIATLEAGGSGHVGIYNDLGTGAVYSVRSISTNETRQTAIIPLDVQFFNDATAASGSQIALGGSIATLDPTNNGNEYLFGYSGGAPGEIQLRLTFGTNMVINSANRGWYNNLGNHTAANRNYVVGDDGTYIYRNFFVFNMPVLSSQLAVAELLVNSYTNASPYGVETYQLYDVTNSITVLTNNASGATSVYADLGSGVVYGGRNVYVSESGFIASLPLNGSFVAAALTNSGGRIALGGTLTSLNPVPTFEDLFGYSSSSVPADAQLWLGFLAAPASQPSFVSGTPAYLGNNQFQLTVSGTTGTTNEIQGTFDFQNWDFIGDLVMTNSATSFGYTNNTVMPYRFFRAEQLQ